MAEGDVIHRLAGRFQGTLVGSEISAVVPGDRGPTGRPVSELEGLRLLDAAARGKHLILSFEGGLAIHSHLGMWGAWHLQPLGERWRKPRRRSWLALDDGQWEAVNFGGSTLRIVPASELRTDRRLASLGPDVLAPGFDPAQASHRLAQAGTGRQLGEVLLDQRLVAGIGNIFKSEACFAAALSPWTTVDRLPEAGIELVLTRASEQMSEAVVSGKRPEEVYRRVGRPCRRCGPVSRIRAAKQGDDARTTYWCERCQPADRARPT